MTRVPTYRAYIDWHNHGGLSHGLSQWWEDPNDGTLEVSRTKYFRGDHSLLVTGTGFPARHLFKVVPDVELTVSTWIYVPTGSDDVIVTYDISDDDTDVDPQTVTTRDEWVEVQHVINATDAATYSLRVGHDSGEGEFHIGWMHIRSDDDDVSCDILATRSVPSVSYGRDSARDLDGTRVGEMNLQLRNEDYRYTPGNNGSPLANKLVPG